jgi:hypothetical protein
LCRTSLRECEQNENFCGLVDIKGADDSAAALLIECRGATEDTLNARVREVIEVVKKSKLPLGRTASKRCGVEEYPFRCACVQMDGTCIAL